VSGWTFVHNPFSAQRPEFIQDVLDKKNIDVEDYTSALELYSSLFLYNDKLLRTKLEPHVSLYSSFINLVTEDINKLVTLTNIQGDITKLNDFKSFICLSYCL
jgi:hypothetical protein